jgi:organic radical activating enzyme
MSTPPESKSCSLKGTQQVFLLQQNQVLSCCSAYAEQLDNTKTIADYQLNWQHERQLLDHGVKINGCKHCWESEDQGKISYRTINNKKNNSAIRIELFLSNLCNHMCSYCSGKYSSVWEESIQTHGVFRNISMSAKNNLNVTQSPVDTDYWIEQIQNYISTCKDNSIILRLLGGEPLMQQRNLEKLLSFNADKIKILMIHTNLNPPTNKFLIWLLDNIGNRKLKLTISLDATPEYNHIPRAGFDRNNFLSNLDLLRKREIDFSFSPVISVLSIFDLENFIPWGNTNGFTYEFIKLNNPDCLNSQYVPLKFRQKIWKTISHLPLDPIIVETLQQPDNIVDLKLFEQYNYLFQYFERTNINPNQISNELFVEYWAWLTEYIKEKFKLYTTDS